MQNEKMDNTLIDNACIGSGSNCHLLREESGLYNNRIVSRFCLWGMFYTSDEQGWEYKHNNQDNDQYRQSYLYLQRFKGIEQIRDISVYNQLHKQQKLSGGLSVRSERLLREDR
jgi:hypothetical protein